MRYCFFVFFFIYAFISQAAELSIGDKVVYEVQVAQNERDLRQGLMNVRSLPKNEGMLFDLRNYPRTSMWMKDTYISLDMLFLDCSFYIVDVHEYATPLSLDNISSDKDFCYVLEVNGGEVQGRKLEIGDKAFLDTNM